jgi:hypothetical protein
LENTSTMSEEISSVGAFVSPIEQAGKKILHWLFLVYGIWLNTLKSVAEILLLTYSVTASTTTTFWHEISIFVVKSCCIFNLNQDNKIAHFEI